MKQQRKRKATVTSLQGKQAKKVHKLSGAENIEQPTTGKCVSGNLVQFEYAKTSRYFTRHLTRQEIRKTQSSAAEASKTNKLVSGRQEVKSESFAVRKEEESQAESAEVVSVKVKAELTAKECKKQASLKTKVFKKTAASKKSKGKKQEAAPETEEVTEDDSFNIKMKLPLPVRGSRLSEKRIKTNKFVGAHTSISGGLKNAVYDAMAMGARAFGLFLKSQRSWNYKPLDEKEVKQFKQAMEECGFQSHMVVPHGSYLMNCGAPNAETLEKSRASLIDDLERCEKLGLPMFNFHPGSTCKKISAEKCISLIAESINIAHSKTTGVITVLENMSCQGGTVGGKFSELASIIQQVTDQSRVGVCLDTCHAFAAGYDLRTEKGYNAMMTEFEQEIGLQYLKAVHLNDSKGQLGSKLDRHANFGHGYLGLAVFGRLMNDPRFDNMPLILETPLTVSDAEEIALLYSLVTE